MLPEESAGKRPGVHAKNGIGEESRLDEAIERADQLLVTSLKQDEHRRCRRRVVFISLGIVVLGGLFMSAILCFVLLVPKSPTVATNVRGKSSGAATEDTTTLKNQRPIESTALALNDPDAAGRLSAEGWSLWQKQAFDDAAAKFDEAVKLDPKNVSAWNGLGWASFNGGNYGPAEKAFRKVISLEPAHPAALNGLGQLALLQHKYSRRKNSC